VIISDDLLIWMLGQSLEAEYVTRKQPGGINVRAVEHRRLLSA
jgi:hypothetical protein